MDMFIAKRNIKRCKFVAGCIDRWKDRSAGVISCLLALTVVKINKDIIIDNMRFWCWGYIEIHLVIKRTRCMCFCVVLFWSTTRCHLRYPR